MPSVVVPWQVIAGIIGPSLAMVAMGGSMLRMPLHPAFGAARSWFYAAAAWTMVTSAIGFSATSRSVPYVTLLAVVEIATVAVLVIGLRWVNSREKLHAQGAPRAPAESDHPAVSQTMVSSPGGIQAGRDVNIGLPRRGIPPQVRSEMVRLLSPGAGTHIAFSSSHGDPEASDFKSELMAVFSESGWKIDDRHVFMLVPESKGLKVIIGEDVPESGPAGMAVSALTKTGNPIGFRRGGTMARPGGIMVQVWRAP